MTLSAGLRLGSYEILEPLGSGGMGEIYRARDHKLDRLVAIKVLPKEDLKPDRLRRFEQEARAASALNHPNIVTIHDIGEHEGRPFIAMELIEGRTLTALLIGGALPLKRLLHIATQVADGLAKAHAAGILHRDLKPDNVMITTDGFAKILDFGLAKLASPPDTSSQIATRGKESTAPGMVLGTVGYMSPEQAKGEPVDFRSDQFAFGSLLYEMATGERAFQRGSAVQTLSAIIEAEPRSIQELNPEVPPPLRWIVERCLAKDKSARYESTSDLARELASLRDHLAETTASGTGSVWARAPKRSRWAGMLVVLVATLLGAAAAWFLLRVDSSDVASSSAPSYLAVSSFRNLSGDSEGQYFAEGFTEAILTRLTHLDGVHVVSDERDIGASLRLEGSIQKSADRLRITYRLVSSEGGQGLGGDVVDGRLEELFELQDRVAGGVSERLQRSLGLELSATASASAAGSPTSDVDAYSFYLQGRGYLRRHDAEVVADVAIRLFEQALERDPDFALAQAGLAEAYLEKYDDTKDPTWVEKATEAAEHALELGEQVAEVHVSLGSVYQETGQYERSAEAFQSAIELDAKNDDAHIRLARAFESSGELEEAERTYRRAIELRPDYYAAWSRLGAFYFRYGRYEEAAEQFQRVIELTPDNYGAYSSLGGMYHLLGRFDDAERAIKQSLAIKPTSTGYTNLGTLYFFQGRYADAVPAMEKAVELEPQHYLYWGNLADTYRWAPGLASKAPDAYRNAIERAEQALSVNPKSGRVRGSLATYWAKLGEADKAATELTKALTDSGGDANVLIDAVTVKELAGDREGALLALDEALRAGYSLEEVQLDPELAELRADPRFRELGSNVAR